MGCVERISAITKLAIEAYRRVARAERRLEELKRELEGWLSLVPEVELQVYAVETQRIQREEDEKLAIFLRRVERKRTLNTSFGNL